MQTPWRILHTAREWRIYPLIEIVVNPWVNVTQQTPNTYPDCVSEIIELHRNFSSTNSDTLEVLKRGKAPNRTVSAMCASLFDLIACKWLYFVNNVRNINIFEKM